MLFKDIIIHYKTLVIPNGNLGIEVSNISFRSPPPGCYNTNLFHEDCNEYALDIMVVNIDSQNVGSPHDVHEVPLGFLVLTSY